jgi:hypothetical protein
MDAVGIWLVLVNLQLQTRQQLIEIEGPFYSQSLCEMELSKYTNLDARHSQAWQSRGSCGSFEKAFGAVNGCRLMSAEASLTGDSKGSYVWSFQDCGAPT